MRPHPRRPPRATRTPHPPHPRRPPAAAAPRTKRAPRTPRKRPAATGDAQQVTTDPNLTVTPPTPKPRARRRASAHPGALGAVTAEGATQPRRTPTKQAASGSLLVSEVAVPAVRVPAAKVALSTASVYPESTAAAFEIARRLGYDGIELMVFTDAVSQDPEAVRALSDYYGVPVLAVHSPCLLVTQRVWSTDPWEKLQRSQAAAERLGASTVVVHPPFRWQRDYARDFEVGLARMRDETDILFAVENMYPWRARNREWAAYQPDWDPRNQDYPHVTLDLSHTAVSGTSAVAMAADLGDRLAHIHLADGTGLARDEHLVPGRGNQQCAEILEGLALQGFTGTVVLEVSTRRAANRAEREADLAEALAFARLNLAAPLVVPVDSPRP